MQRYSWPCAQGYMTTWIHNNMDTWPHGYTTTWVHNHMDLQPHEHWYRATGVWINSHMLVLTWSGRVNNLYLIRSCPELERDPVLWPRMRLRRLWTVAHCAKADFVLWPIALKALKAQLSQQFKILFGKVLRFWIRRLEVYEKTTGWKSHDIIR